jgi:predicted protein tyrosine phosphatase
MRLMIYICGLHGVTMAAAQVTPRFLISITDPGTPAPSMPGIEPAQHLKLMFHDLDAPLCGYTAPQREDIEQIIAFAAGWDRQSPLLVHCHAGARRSMATAVILQVLSTTGQERDVARLLRARAPHAHPNPRMIMLADVLLARNGRLIAAVEAMGPATQVVGEGPLVHLWLAP